MKGADQHPLYRFLMSADVLPNWEVKFSGFPEIPAREGREDPRGKFFSAVESISKDLTGAIEAALR